MALADFPQALDERNILRQPRLLELNVATSPVAVRQTRRALPRHRSGHFPFLLQLHHRAPAFFQILRWPVDLVEVDYIDIQPAQTVFAFAADRSRR